MLLIIIMTNIKKKDNITNHPIYNIYNLEISNLIEIFLNTKKSEKTKKSYYSDLNSFFKYSKINKWSELIDLYGNYTLSNIISEYININKKFEEWDKNKLKNPRTVNRKAYALSSFFKFLQKKYNFSYNPVIFDAYNTPKYSNTESINRDDLIWILNFMKEKIENKNAKSNIKKLTNIRNYLIFCFLSFSLRRNEISKLKWEDINNDNKYINVEQKWWTYKLIPIPEKIFELLNEYKLKKKIEWYYWDYIFSPFNNNRTKNTNKPLTTDYLYSLVIKNWNEYKSFWNISKINEQIKKISNRKKYLNKIKQKYENKKEKENKFEDISNEILIITEEYKKLIKLKKEIIKEQKQISCHSFRKTFVEQAILRWDDFIEIQNATWHSNVNMISYYQTIDKTKHNSINKINDLY